MSTRGLLSRAATGVGARHAAGQTGAHMHYCHVNSTSQRHIDRVLGLVGRAQAEGARVTTEAYPMNRLVALVMLLTLAAICMEILQGQYAWWIGWGSLLLTGSGFVPTMTRTVPNAASTGAYRDAMADTGVWVLKTQVGRREVYAQSFGDNVTGASGGPYGDVAVELIEEGRHR